MMQDDLFELTTEERSRLAGLPRELAPSGMLEQRVINALRQGGQLPGGRVPNHALRTALRIAAAAALFAGGMITARYLMLDDVPASATITAPQRPQELPPPHETVVAEREVWL